MTQHVGHRTSDEINRLRARIAELEKERDTTTTNLFDANQDLRAANAAQYDKMLHMNNDLAGLRTENERLRKLLDDIAEDCWSEISDSIRRRMEEAQANKEGK